MTAYNKLTYDGKKVQVDSAIRDGSGANIENNYAKKTEVAGKQDALVSGTNIKTINNESLLGSGDITIGGGGGGLKQYTSSDFSSVFEVANGTLTIKKSLYIVINYLSDTSSNYGADYNTTIILPAGKTYTVGSVLPNIVKDAKMFYDVGTTKTMSTLFRLVYRNADPRVYFEIRDVAAGSNTVIYNAKNMSTFTISDSIIFLIEQ